MEGTYMTEVEKTNAPGVLYGSSPRETDTLG